MILEFTCTLIEWRGPAPFVFAPVPQDESEMIEEVSSLVTYGWGAIPANIRIGGSDFETALFPKDGLYLVPVKTAVQKAEELKVGDKVTVRLEIRV
jgi:hypothetical protein